MKKPKPVGNGKGGMFPPLLPKTKKLPKEPVPPAVFKGDPQEYTVAELMQWVADHLGLPGCICPACGQLACERPRSLTPGMAATLCVMYGQQHTKLCDKNGFYHVKKIFTKFPELYGASHEFAAVLYWNLAETVPPELRKDGHRYSGKYRLTEKGKAFVLGERRVHRAVKVFNGERGKFVKPMISVHEALKNQFNYNQLCGFIE